MLCKPNSSGIWGLVHRPRLNSWVQCEDCIGHPFSIQDSEVKLQCSEYALDFVGAVGGNVNVHLMRGCHVGFGFFFMCIWKSHFPFGFLL